MAAVDTLEQIVEKECHAHKKNFAEEIAGDAGAKKRLSGGYIGGRRSSISMHDQFVWNVDKSKYAWYRN